MREREMLLELFLDPPQLRRARSSGVAEPAQVVQERLAREQYLAAGGFAGDEPGEQVQRATPQNPKLRAARATAGSRWAWRAPGRRPSPLRDPTLRAAR